MELKRPDDLGRAYGLIHVNELNQLSENKTNPTSNPGGSFPNQVMNGLKPARQSPVLTSQNNVPSDKQLADRLDGSAAPFSQDVRPTVEDSRSPITDPYSIQRPFNAAVTTPHDLQLIDGFDAEHRLNRMKTENAYYVRNTGSTIPDSDLVRCAVSIYSRGGVRHRYFAFDEKGQVMPILHKSQITSSTTWTAAGVAEWYVVKDVANRKPLEDFVETVTKSQGAKAPSGDGGPR